MPAQLWPEVWQELQNELRNQPRCPEHPQYPCVTTLALGVINDIVEVSEEGIKIVSHLTGHEDFLKASQVKKWWDHLVMTGSASLRPDDAPDSDRSRIVGAILVTCLPNRITLDEGSKSIITLG